MIGSVSVFKSILRDYLVGIKKVNTHYTLIYISDIQFQNGETYLVPKHHKIYLEAIEACCIKPFPETVNCIYFINEQNIEDNVPFEQLVIRSSGEFQKALYVASLYSTISLSAELQPIYGPIVQQKDLWADVSKHVGRLYFEFDGGSGTSTAFYVAERMICTAAHCLLGLPPNRSIYFKMDDSLSSKLTMPRKRVLEIEDNYYKDWFEKDYVFLYVLDDDHEGYLELSTNIDADKICIIGYPCSAHVRAVRKYADTFPDNEKEDIMAMALQALPPHQKLLSAGSVESVLPTGVIHSCSTAAGMSGAPIFACLEDRIVVIGMHRRSIDSNRTNEKHRFHNLGLFFKDNYFDLLEGCKERAAKEAFVNTKGRDSFM